MNSQQIAAFFDRCPAGVPYANTQAAPAVAWLITEHNPVRFVAVAGTARKTTVSRMVAGILHKAGFVCGCYTVGDAPLKERIQLSGKPVQVPVLAKPTAALEQLPAVPPRTVAELAASCGCFAACGCDFARHSARRQENFAAKNRRTHCVRRSMPVELLELPISCQPAAWQSPQRS